MADLLTHILVPFIVLTAVGWVVSFDSRWVSVAMGGAAIPDLGRIDLLIDDAVIKTAIGLPFDWTPFGTISGVLVISAVIAIWFSSERHIAYGWLVAGGISALVLDALRVVADGHATFWLYPVWIRTPTPSLYVSSDIRVTLFAILLAIAVFVLDRFVVDRAG